MKSKYSINFAMGENAGGRIQLLQITESKVKFVLIVFVCLTCLQLIFGSIIFKATYTILFNYDQLLQGKRTLVELNTVFVPKTRDFSSLINTSVEHFCPKEPTNLIGPVKVSLKYRSFCEMEALFNYLDEGGHGKPSNCTSNDKVALVIPFRDREKHLRAFLYHMHPILTRQNLDYAIYVVEQVSNQTFNRAKLMNIGYTEARKQYSWQCIVFHDVDHSPEDDRILYNCPEHPRHLLPYEQMFGGVSALKVEHFEQVNGFSNNYWGWGGEDDDMYYRIWLTKQRVIRYPADVARYKMMGHAPDKQNEPNPCRLWYLNNTALRWKKDGLSSLEYKLLKLEKRKLFTWILVDLLEEKTREKIDEKHLCSFWSI